MGNYKFDTQIGAAYHVADAEGKRCRQNLARFIRHIYAASFVGDDILRCMRWWGLQKGKRLSKGGRSRFEFESGGGEP